MRDSQRATSARTTQDAVLSGETRPRRSKRWAHYMWHIGRVLATIAAVVSFYALWLPWEVIQAATFTRAGDQWQTHVYTLTIGPGDLETLYGQVFWGMFTAFWVAICILLWQRAWVVLEWGAVALYVLWLRLEPVLGPDIPSKDQLAYLVDPNGPQHPIVFAEPYRLPGSYLFFSAIGLAFVGFLFLAISRLILREEFRSAIRIRPTARPSYSISGSRALLAGIVLWALGALVLPWRAGGCVPIPIVTQSCVPGGFGDMLQRGLAGDPAQLNARIGMYALPALLVYLALLALAGLWRRVPLRLLGAWVGLWLAGVAITLAFATRGILLTQPGAVGPGPFVTLAGLLTAACGLAWLLSSSLDSPVEPAQPEGAWSNG